MAQDLDTEERAARQAQERPRRGELLTLDVESLGSGRR
jgi:hypothetical protein